MEDISGGSNMDDICISRATLIGYYNECKKKYDCFLHKVMKVLHQDHLSMEIKQVLSKLIYDYKVKMKAARYNVQHFKRKNKDWMESYITFAVNLPPSSRKRYSSGNDDETRGRPEKQFAESSDRSKRRKTEELREKYSPRKLVYAAQMSYRAKGELAASKVLREVGYDPKQAENLKKAANQCQEKMSAEKALSLVLEAGLTKNQYNLIVSYTREAHCNLFPNYETITEAKTTCYPDTISVTEVCAEAPLQELLDHTTKRLCLSLNEGLVNLTENQKNNLCRITKWGCDGSGSHSQYNQKFSSSEYDDSYMFITSIVPIRLVYEDEEIGSQTIVWQNPRPSSTRYCRPVRLQLTQETTETSKIEELHIKSQISSLVPTVTQINQKDFTIKHKLYMTMLDGKMVNSITNTTSAQRCYLCKLTTKDFNRISYCINKEICESRLQLGISSLHAWIRFAECILHIGYKLPISKHQARGIETKTRVNAEKKRVQNEFLNKLGLHVDKPRPGGGTSTTGNVAREILRNANVTSEITGVHKKIIQRLHIILCVISSGYDIKKDEFKKYCLKTAQSFVFMYPWYNMPTTMQKVLIHGSDIIESAETAIGLLSEDAQEARNKDVRSYRENYSRKFTRILTLEDTFHRLLASSDPYITGMRKLYTKGNALPLPQAALALIKEPNM